MPPPPGHYILYTFSNSNEKKDNKTLKLISVQEKIKITDSFDILLNF